MTGILPDTDGTSETVKKQLALPGIAAPQA